ncbi:pentapeptide repeat-containing protein [Amycolatopsis sp. NPDC004079]|uniref:pentapeptide repeat-containing protein n=1 Tax=Amycolatopsis sp. NPDC004079 TaxID=3154549 RepID=UPI0033AD1F6F
MTPRTKQAMAVAGGVLALVVFALLLWRGPWWLDGSHLRERDLQPADGAVVTGFRTTLVAIGAGVVGGLGLLYTHKNHRHTQKLFDLHRQEQLTGRYVEAIKLLGDANTDQRIGGIYSLERILRDSEADHDTVLEVLAAFLRHRSPGTDSAAPRPPEDLQAAVTVLCRRPIRDGEPRLDLRRVELRRGKFQNGQLRRVDFEAALLGGADFIRADLRSADFENTDLEEANLTGANMDNAKLLGANLRGAWGLTADQLVSARIYRDTKLSDELAGNERVRARIAECEAART